MAGGDDPNGLRALERREQWRAVVSIGPDNDHELSYLPLTSRSQSIVEGHDHDLHSGLRKWQPTMVSRMHSPASEHSEVRGCGDV